MRNKVIILIILMLSLSACGKNDSSFLCRVDDIDENILTVTPDVVSHQGIKYGTMQVSILDETVYLDAENKIIDKKDVKIGDEILVTYSGDVASKEHPGVIARKIQFINEYIFDDSTNEASAYNSIVFDVNGVSNSIQADNMGLKDFELSVPHTGWLISRPQSSVVGPMTIYPQDDKEIGLKLTEYVVSDFDAEKTRLEKSIGEVEWVDVEADSYVKIKKAETDDCEYWIIVSKENVLVVEMICPKDNSYYPLLAAMVNTISVK